MARYELAVTSSAGRYYELADEDSHDVVEFAVT